MSATEADRRVKEQAVRLLSRMQARLDAAEARFNAPVAIVGIGCRLPLGDTPDAVWTALAEGRDAIRTVPPDRWAAGEGATAWGGFLSGIDCFDAAFFGISPREAAVMDPQQRLALEVAWEALEHAGIPADRLEGTRTGVYLGCCTADYARLGDPDEAASDGYAATGGAPGVAAGRIAYTLGLNGPALVVDTACSSSLVAVHLAVQGLRAGECELALAGGVNLTLLPQGATTLDRLHMLSPAGRCRAFDAEADGFVRGEGCGVLVLKLLTEAQAAGDRVLAVIRGTAVNQDGRSAGLTAPNGPAQEAVIRAALQNAGLTPGDIDGIEAHGTGTPLGDPIEMHALASVFGERPRELLVGSIKTNIGHAEAAAGVAGLIKAVLVLGHQAMPPSLHFQRLNPHIEIGGAPIRVPTALAQAQVARMGVSSFGFSGTNAHVVLERADNPPLPLREGVGGRGPARPVGTAWPAPPIPLPQGEGESVRPHLLISARTPDALQALIAAYRSLLAVGVPFKDLAHSAQVGRARLPWWVCVSCPAALATAEPSDASPPDLPPQPGRRVDLPLYPFQRQRHWLDESGRLPGRRLVHAGETPVFDVQLLPNASLLADHRIRGERLLPAADMLERLRAAADASGQGAALRDVSFERPLAVPSPKRVQVIAGNPLILFARDGETWTRHAIASATAAEPAEPVDLPALQALCAEPVDLGAFAAWLGGIGLEYGPFYDCIAALSRGPGQALARLRPASYVALLDAAFRTAGAIAAGQGGVARLPAGLARYDRAAPATPADLWAHAALIEDTPGVSVVDVRLLDGDGTVLARIEGLRLAATGTSQSWRQALHVLEWTRSPSPASVCDAVIAGLGDTAEMEAALDAAAAGYAGQALAEVTPAEVAPRYRRLWHHLARLAARDAAYHVPEGPEGALLARCGAALAGVLKGTVDPLPLLFGDGAAGGIYRDAPAYRAANTIVATLAAAMVPPTGPLRVLEIGAGTGGTTEAVLTVLDPARLDYWFTDGSATLVAQARGRIAAQHFVAFDVERPLAEQGIPTQTFDLVLAANVLHGTADLGAALDHTLQALAPDGRLLLLETAPPSDPPAGWIDLVFGLTEGWWRFTDITLRPDYPLLTEAAWTTLLESRGLDVETRAVPGNTVIMARRGVAERRHHDTGGTAAERCAALLATIQDLRPDERRLVLLTRGAVGPAVSDPAAAALWGMMRTLRQERPNLELRCIDNGDPAAERMTAEPEIVFAGGERFLPRLSVPVPSAEAVIDPDRWVLITGAFGGLGRFIVDRLVQRGARRLVLTGRTVPKDDWVEALRHAGITVQLEACDLADPAARDALIDRLPPLAGIVHAAGVLDDATLARAVPEQFASVLAPKLEAALALDKALPVLDFFILFSSAVGLFGQSGQATHVAASTALDALAAVRRQRGQHAVSLGWGLWREVGSAAGRTALIRRMDDQGLGAISNEIGGAVLDWALGAREAAVTVLPIDRSRFLGHFERPPAATRTWRAERRPALPRPATPVPESGDLADIVAAEAALVMGYGPGQTLDRNGNLFDMGLDSLMAVELRNRLLVRLPGRTLSSTLLFDHGSVNALAVHLAGGKSTAAAPTVAAPADAAVAIIGVGCRFPGGGTDPEAFWEALAEGRDGVVPRPNRPDATVAEGAARQAGYLTDVSGFDPTFFGIAPREAVFMDPQHRLVLEVVWEALENALIPPDRLSGTPTGVFLGMCNYDYGPFAAAAGNSDGYAGTGGAPSIAAGRVSYLFGLTGPAMVVDTACSSSLVTVHLAVQALRRGECTLALAGGVNLTLGAGTTTALEQLSMLSPDARCKAFDARADGFVRGEGCGMVVLKRLAQAEADGDRVLAVIRGTSVNQDGRSVGLTAPSGPAQEAVIRAALTDARVDPDAVDYVEAHGTGTALGDPIEMHALASVFGGRSRDLLVGSVKSNIGHAEAAAGIAGLVKAILMLRHQAVPPSLHFQQLNPHIELGEAPIAVPTALIPRPLACVGVSSFGISGTNAHAVLERGPAGGGLSPLPQGEGGQPARLLISARTPVALRALIDRYRAKLAAGADFRDLCHSAATGRSVLRWWVCVDHPDALATAEPSDAPPPELPPQPGNKVDLPLYPFQRQSYWAHPARTPGPPALGTHPLLGRRLRSSLATRQYEAVLAPDQPAWLADHAVGGRVVVPAAALIEMMLAAAPRDVALTGIAFHRMLAPAEQSLVQTAADPAGRTITISAAADTEEPAFVAIASATWEPVADPAWEPAGTEATRPVDVQSLYDRFAAAGLAYGPAFRMLRTLRSGPAVAVAELGACDPQFRLDPRVLDAAWQSLAAAVPPDSTAALVPAGLDRLVWRGGTPCTSEVRLVAPDRADIALFDAQGGLVAWCGGLRLAAAPLSAVAIHQTEWDPIPSGTEWPDWLDCRAETDPAAACWRVLEAFRSPPAGRFAVLARGATPAGGTQPLAAQAVLVGLLATLAQERPEMRPVLLDLDATAEPPPIPAESGPLLAWRDGTLLAPRLESRPMPAEPSAPFALARGVAATLDALHWTPATRRIPGPGEVEIEIAAAGINFRDVMNLLGVYPGDGGVPGVECAGTVVSIGRDVASVAVGDPVLAIAPGCFASHVIADAHLVCRIPAALDWRIAAAQPVAVLTAQLALVEEAHLAPGQRVLIHAATGGVGLAALAVARRLGAEIVATAGSPAKRAHLAALGVAEVHDSRSLDFAAAAPVDVLVNSLIGAAIPAGLRLLKPGGVFLELGKAEVWTEAQVRAVRPDVRYTAIALDELILNDPARVGTMLAEAVAALAAGAEPLPIQPYAFGDVTEALRCLQAARHIGKLVLSRALFRSDASYVITGGTGALGRHLARWLAARGARHLVLLARRPDPVEIAGAAVRSIAVDVSEEAAVRQALSGLPQPVKGVFHLAGALHDATAAQVTRAQLDAVLATKLRGAEVLSRVTAGMKLDQFVLFGSLAGVAGSAGQASYAAANAALDAVVRAHGGPALLVDWGAWQGEGMARGFAGPALAPQAALQALDAALSAGLTRVAVSAGTGRAAPVMAGLAERLAGAIGSGKLTVLADAVDEAVSRILGLGTLALERERPLTELGLDSLMAVELRNALGAAIGRTLPTSLVFDHPTAEALSVFLAGELGLVTAPIPEPAPPPAPVPMVIEDDDGLDDDAALLLLERKLNHAGY